MRPLAIGVSAAVVLAGPPLYSLVQAGTLPGSTALFRGLLVMAACTVMASFLNGIISDFEKDAKQRTDGKVVHHPNTGGAPGSDDQAPGSQPGG